MGGAPLSMVVRWLERGWARLLVHALAAVAVLWPALPRLGEVVPGADRTDVWNALWSLDFFARALAEGAWPYRTTMLDPPAGGVLWVADPVHALVGAPLTLAFGAAVAWTLLLHLQLTLTGWLADHLARSLLPDRAAPAISGVVGLFAGLATLSAPSLLAAIHNGTSEGTHASLLLLSLLTGVRAARAPGIARLALAAFALGLAAFSSAYSGLIAMAFALALVLRPPDPAPGARRRALLVLLLALALVLPAAVAIRQAASAPDNLVRIKHERELALVRRSTGAADPRGYLLGGDFRSPDFARISRYGEQFQHTTYLGWVLLLLAWPALRRPGPAAFLVLGGGACLVLSLGPVLVRDGMAWILPGDRAIPLPYLLVERLPGFRDLSLLHRLSLGPALALGPLAAATLARRPRWLLPALAAFALEQLAFSPSGGRVEVAALPPAGPFRLLADAPPGVVLNFPVVGGRAYLYEQTVHRKPMAGTLNFPNNALGQRSWRELLAAAEELPAEPDAEQRRAFRLRLAGGAAKGLARYVVVHADPVAVPDMHDNAVAALVRGLEPLAAAPGPDGEPVVSVYALW